MVLGFLALNQPMRAIALEKGSKDKAIALVLRLLARRVGADAAVWCDRLEPLSLQKLETLAEDLLDLSTEDDLVAWMEQQGGM